MIITVFKIIGYEMKTPEGNFMESCTFWIYESEAKKAISKAKLKGVKKKHYQVVEVIEKDESASS